MKKKLYQILSLCIFLIVLGVAYYKGPQLWNDLKNIHLVWAAGGLGIYFVNYLLRAERLRIISKHRISIYPDAIHSSSLHGVATYFLPIRTGDLTLPLILRSSSDIELMEGSQILVKARFLDIVTLGMCMMAAALFTTASISPLARILWFFCALGMTLLPYVIKWLRSVEWFDKRRKSLVFIAFENITAISSQEILVSLVIWLAVASCFYCTARAIGLGLGVGDVAFLITIQLPLQLIPVQGFANAGNHEGGWIAGLALLGVSASDSVAFALTSHALLIVYVLALGVVALITSKRFTQ